MDLRPSMSPFLEAFAVEATVTISGGAPVETEVIWLPPERRVATDEVFEFGNELRRRDPERKVMSIPRSDVPAAPVGTEIEAPEIEGGAAQTWRVEGHERALADEHRVIVVPA